MARQAQDDAGDDRTGSPRKLAGRVKVDDAYLGGEHPGGKRGRASENKTPFIAAVATQDGRPTCVRFDRVRTFSSKEVESWAKQALVPRRRPCRTDCRHFGAWLRTRIMNVWSQAASRRA